MKSSLLALVLVATAGLSACGGDDTEVPSADFLDTIAPTATVQGRLFNTDTSFGNRRPTTGTVILSGAAGAKVSDEAGPDGRFEFSVAPGDYAVTGTSPQSDGGTAQCAAQEPSTTVAAGAPTVVDVFCVVQ